MKTLILYKSKHGSTQEYSKFLQSKIPNSDIFLMDSFDMQNVNDYEYIIIGSPTYMGQVQAVSFLTENWEYLKEKKIFVFTVGMMTPEETSSLAAYNAIPENIKEKIQYRKLPGRLVYSKLGILEKLIIKMMKAKDTDKVDVSSVEPILKFVTV